MPYYSDKGLSLFKFCMQKLNLIASKLVPLNLILDITLIKLSFICNTKDKAAVLWNSFVYDFSCPDCGANYIRKTERTLYAHAWTDINSAVCKHLNCCTTVQYLLDITSLHLSQFTSSSRIQNSDKFDLRTARFNLVHDNTGIIDRHKNWNTILFKEALKIKEFQFWTLD